MSNNNPSIDPANNGSLAGTLQFAFERMMMKTDGMLPARVIQYDRDKNRVQVQMLITMITTNGEQVPRPQVASLPVLLMGGGGFLLSFPIKTGDLGWVMASDRDISLFLQNYNQSPPNSERVKSFSDGLFIPDTMTNYQINSAESDSFVIQSLDGQTIISVGDDEIKIESPAKISIKAPSVDIDLGSPGNIMTVNGSITATGSITP